ncbi:ligase-like protein [Elsinoe australis]|uniref:Ligase-like protein n=1 Tax=Elsinoe australis TaxID=40998 RepID=A0A4U7AVC4_9PEZI|nr:ligase-like protein [Elsinoe australis]
MKVALLYQSLTPPEIGGVRKPPKPGGYQDSGADIAYALKHLCNIDIVTPISNPDPSRHEGWSFPDSEDGILAAVRAGATTLWANTILFADHPLQTSSKLTPYESDLYVVGQPPRLVETYDDKYIVNDFLRSQGSFTLPKFCTTTSAELDHLSRLMNKYGLDFPVVGKPIRGRGSHGVKVCRSMEELSIHAAEILGESPRIILEQFLSGAEGTVTTMPPSTEAPEYWAMPVVVRYNHMDGVAPYNGVVAVAANSKVPPREEMEADAAYAAIARECEQVAKLLQATAPMRIDVRRVSDEPGTPFALFDVNPKPNMTVSGRPGREDQASLTAIAAEAMGWDGPTLLRNILKTASPLSELRSTDLTPAFKSKRDS